jgi:hypothetical protein
MKVEVLGTSSNNRRFGRRERSSLSLKRSAICFYEHFSMLKPNLKMENRILATKLRTKQTHLALVLLALFATAMITINSYDLPQAYGQSNIVLTVTGFAGASTNYSLADIQSMPAVNMYGGFYQPNQRQINNGLWKGVSLFYICNQTGGITPTCDITIIGQGINNFTYDMVANGLNFNSAYKTYNNATGALQNQTQPITLILAYQINGTDLPSSSLPAPRLVIVGPEGLLMDGSGGRSITQVNITNFAPTPTPTPTAIPTPTPTITPTITPTVAPTLTPTSVPTAIPTATPSETPTPTSTPTPSVSATIQPTLTNNTSPTQNPTPTENSTPTQAPTASEQPIVLYGAIAAAIIIVVIAAAVIFRKRK